VLCCWRLRTRLLLLLLLLQQLLLLLVMMSWPPWRHHGLRASTVSSSSCVLHLKTPSRLGRSDGTPGRASCAGRMRV
jgi:hypothetical protein